MSKKTSRSTPDEYREISIVLRETGAQLTPEELFLKCGRDSTNVDAIEYFFEELSGLIGAGLVEELRPDNKSVMLRVKS